MVKENVSQEFRLNNIDETRNYFIKEVNQNELMSKNHKKVGEITELFWTLTHFSFYSY